MKKGLAILVAFLLIPLSAGAASLVTGKTRYRFKPGDRILFRADFKNCPVGEPPENFDRLEGALECVKFENRIFVSHTSTATMVLGKKVPLGRDDFAIDFDLVWHKTRSYDRFFLKLYSINNGKWQEIKGVPGAIEVNGYCELSVPGAGQVASFRPCKDKIKHIAVQVRRGQFRVYLNSKRVTSLPFHLDEKSHVDGFALIHDRSETPYQVLVSSIRVTKYTEKEAKPTPEKLGISVNETGKELTLTVPEKVLFDFNKFVLKPEAKKALNVVADVIRDRKVKKIVVTGYTDNIGSDAYNLKLSLQRAQSVADYLMYCQNINPELFEIVGKGKANPIADNSTEAGRARNRRVEIQIIKK